MQPKDVKKISDNLQVYSVGYNKRVGIKGDSMCTLQNSEKIVVKYSL